MLASIRFNADGLVPAIAQDYASGRVLMMAWMNEEAIRQTLATGFAHYYSRSRQRQWKKGETSGHVQRVRELLLDCDGDTLLLKIEQHGPACHTNRTSCFYRRLEHDTWHTIEEPRNEP
ncbi:MAG: phosphoribosyl-AMP cyclohydrolase [Zetaproteobacteria bacterium]|nr:MAG: phosphoribosyl-AMP cyclohydrolase [Zetaproteobacteria bacterium]